MSFFNFRKTPKELPASESDEIIRQIDEQREYEQAKREGFSFDELLRNIAEDNARKDKGR
ncbi:hypothetical protein [Noviherbaspirillum pedocola]|uniref:Uncharacterized protein n=1 Tax=Noviherbaspirillum pedocola TaxID=2801341 RepID=A0A934W8K7_9BURK|nr:hypothetical protein [Noviherbaspirillum pedocola]MBK4735939.1 hypothetical protein [Noviherbaspirillum pedocola]